MARHLVILRVLGILLVAHALMLLGADEISTIEAGGVRTIRSLNIVLALYFFSLLAGKLRFLAANAALESPFELMGI